MSNMSHHHHEGGSTHGHSTRPTKIPTESSHAAAEIVKNIPVIKNILRTGGVEFFNTSKSTGLLYLSRFVSKVHNRAISLRASSTEGENGSDAIENIIHKEKDIGMHMSAEGKVMKRRYAMSLATLASKNTKKFKIVENGVIAVLNDYSLTSDDDIISMACASAFVFLSKEPNLRQKLIDENCLSSIMFLLQNPHYEIKKDCFRVLCNLSLIEGFEKRVAKEGVAGMIVPIVKKNHDIIEVCLKMLLNLSCVTEKFARLEEVAVSLIELYHLYHSLEDKELLMIQALCNLSSIRGYHYQLVEEGLLQVIEKAMKSPVKKCHSIAAECLKNLSTCPRTRGKLVDYNVMKLLVTVLTDDSIDVRINCLNTFFNFAMDSTCVSKVASTQVLNSVVAMCMTSTTVELCRTLARVLKVLCSYPNICAKLMLNKVIAALDHISNYASGNAAAIHFAVESVRLLYIAPELHQSLKSQMALALLVNLAAMTTSSITKESCAFALHYVVERGLCTEQDVSDSVLPCLVALYDKTSSNANYLSAATLAVLTKSPTIDASSAVPILVQMLTGEPVEGTSRNAASALCNLSRDPKTCEAMLECGALIPVVQLTQSEDGVTKMTCANILSTLSLHSFSQFRHAAVLSVLLRLSKVDHIPTQRRIVIALSNLSQNSELRSLLLEQKPIPFINSLASKPDENIRRGCAAIVCNLAYDVGSEAAFARADIVTCLLIIALVSSDQLNSKITCVKALVNLMGDSSLLHSMMKDGIVWGMSSLAVFGSDEMLGLCSDALCHLAHHYPRQVLSSPAVGKVVTQLISHPEKEYTRKGVRLLCHLLPYVADDVADDVKFCKGVLEHCDQLKSYTEPDICGMFLYCLCTTSRFVECRILVLELNILNELSFDTIAKDAECSISYIVTLIHVAMSCSESGSILTQETFTLLQKISSCSSSSYIGCLVIKVLYLLSCHTENICKLDNPLCFEIFENAYNCAKATKETSNLAVGFLFNLTTCEAKQHSFVSMGIVRMFLAVWSEAKENRTSCDLVMTGLCQLACGHVNTSRMIDDGCGDILVLATSNSDEGIAIASKLRSSTWERCAATWRNLFCNVGHQTLLVAVGGLDSIIAIAQRATLEYYPSSVILNCTAALRAITFNPELRARLADTPAVDIILTNLAEGVIASKNATKLNLLRELETESWSNGSRGREKDGKAAHIPCESIYKTYVEFIEVTLPHLDISVVQLSKYLVKAELDYEAEQSEIAMSKEMFTYEIEGKSVYDADESNQLRVQPWSKQGCDESDNPLYFVRYGVMGVVDDGSTRKGSHRVSSADSTIGRKPSKELRRLSSTGVKNNASPRRPSSSLQVGSLLDDNPAPDPKVASTFIPKSSDRKKMDNLVATIRRAKRAENHGTITTEDILKQYKTL